MALPPTLKNSELTLQNIPNPDTASEQELWSFAHTFIGYDYFGGLEQAFEANDVMSAVFTANLDKFEDWHNRLPTEDEEVDLVPSPRLAHIRNDMFLECRANRFQDPRYQETDALYSTLRNHVRMVRTLVGRGDID